MADIIISTASVRIQSETRKAERDARRSGRKVGKEFARGADRESGGAFDDVLSPGAVRGLNADAYRAGSKAGQRFTVALQRETGGSDAHFRGMGSRAGDQFVRGARDKVSGGPPLPAPPVEDAEVRLVPVDRAFKARIRTLIREVQKGAAAIPLTAKGEQFRRQVAQQVAEVERSVNGEIPFDPVLAAGFRRELEAKVKTAALGVRADVHVGVDVDRSLPSRLMDIIRLGSRMGSTFGSAGRTVGSTFVAMGRTIGESFSAATAQAANLGGGLLKVVAVVFSLQTLIPAVVTGITLLLGLITAAVGGIVAGLAGLPVLITGLLAPVAAVMLGFDGIKRAAEKLKKPVEDMRKALSLTFERTFRPIFDSMVPLISSVNTGLHGVVTSLAFFAKSLTALFTSAEGLRKVEAALAGVGLMIDRLRPGAVALVNAFLNIAATHELYRILGNTISGITERLGNMFERMRESGELVRALKAVEIVLLSIVDLFVVLAEGTMRFFTGSAPGLKGFFDALSEALSRVNWEGLGRTFGSFMERLGKAFADLPPEVWRDLGDAIGKMADQFLTLIESGGLTTFVDTISGLINMVSGINSVFKAIEDGLNWISGSGPETAGGWMNDNVTKPVTDAAGKVPSMLGMMGGAFGRFFSGLGSGISSFAVALPGILTGALSTLVSTVTHHVTNGLEQMGRYVSDLPGKIAYGMAYVAMTVVLGIIDVVNKIVEVFSELPGRIMDWLTLTGYKMILFWSEIPGRMIEIAKAIIEGILDWWMKLPGRTWDLLKATGQVIWDFFTKLPGQLWDWAKQAVSSFFDELGKMPDKAKETGKDTTDGILEWIKGIPGKLWQAGKDAVSGFIQGIKDKANELYQAAKDVINNAIRGAKDALIAHSPSVAFQRMGIDSIRGYIIGLRDQIAPLVAQVRAVFAKAMEAATVQLADATLPDLGAKLDVSGQIGNGLRFPTAAEFERAMTAALASAELRADGHDLVLTVRNTQKWWEVR